MKVIKINTREQIVKNYFDAWLKNDPQHLRSIFDKDIIYSECWGPEYKGIEKVIYWFNEWNTRGKVYQWDIKQFVHQENTTAVEWYFRNLYSDGKIEDFDGVSLIEWTENDQIKNLKEFGSKRPHYDPYA